MAKLSALEVPLIIFTFKKAATTILGPIDGNGLLPSERRLAGARVYVMPGPYAATVRVDAALAELRAHLDG